MTTRSATQAIEQHVLDTWTDPLGMNQPATSIAWPNVPFDPPATPWLEVAFSWSNGLMQTAKPEQQNIVLGILQLTIYGPLDQGDGPLQLLADALRAAFNRVALDSGAVQFGAVSGPQPDETDGWRVVLLTAPFEVTE